MVRIRTLVLLYTAHVRARPLPELLALLGIAAGVALLFAVQVANKSVTGSFEQLTESISGRASLEVAARSPQGFNQDLFKKISRLPDVDAAAPIVERRIVVEGPKGHRTLTLIGLDDRITRLGGSLGESIAHQRNVSDLGFYLTEPTAKAIGVRPGRTVTLEVGERIERLPLAGIAQSDEIGSLSQSPIAVAHLGLAQEIASMPKRISRILVAPLPNRKAETKAALRKVSSNTLNVRESDSEVNLLKEAAASDRQSSALFSAISLVVGMLLAYNAMLLSIMQRRRDVASLDALGAARKSIVASLIFDALILGVAGSLVGIILGDQLSRHFLHQVPGFLSSAFAIGDQRVVEPETILISFAGGTLAALAATAKPAIELLKVHPLEVFSERGPTAVETRSSTAQKRLFWAGLILVFLFIVFSLILPETILVGMAALILGMVMILPMLITSMLSLALRLARHSNSAALRISISELVATPVRATALAAVGALTMFAILAVTGPSRDLKRGVGQLTANIYNNADLWVSPRLEDNPYIKVPFNPESAAKRISRLPVVESVRPYRGSYFDLGDRRLGVIGVSGKTRSPLALTQIIDGDPVIAARRLREGGWAALTETVAKERNIKIGEEFSLPTPSGKQRFRLAATITNYGWPSGVLVLNERDYSRIWKTRQATALQVDLAEGTTTDAGKNALRGALGKSSALMVNTSEEGREINAITIRQGLERLDQIANMVLVAAVLAVVAAMLGSVWQRRQRLWGLVSLGMRSNQLYGTILLETGLILLLGGLIGVAFGFLGQAFGDRWVQMTTAYPVPFTPAIGLAFKTLIMATMLAVLVIAIPVRFVFSKKTVKALSSE